MRVSRKTKQKEILEELVEKENSFFSAKELHKKAQKIDKDIGIATVYRFLKNEVSKLKLNSYICERRQVYSKQKTHCHFIDEETGEITHFDIDSIDFLKNKVSGKINSINIEIKGRKE